MELATCELFCSAKKGINRKRAVINSIKCQCIIPVCMRMKVIGHTECPGIQIYNRGE